MLADLITPHTLHELAGTAAFQRGEAYFSEGIVGHLIADDDAITARVQGTATYRVELIGDDDELAYDCTCPRAADGYFCKHCVAVGLAWLTERAWTAESGRDDDPGKLIREYLARHLADTARAGAGVERMPENPGLRDPISRREWQSRSGKRIGTRHGTSSIKVSATGAC